MKHIHVTANVRSKAGMEEQVKIKLMDLISKARSENECICYYLHQSVDDPCLFLFYENWASKHGLDQHLDKPYMKEFFEKVQPLLVGPPDIKTWEMISEEKDI